MRKDIAIFVMSTFRNKLEDKNKSLIEYSDKNGDFNEICEHTNEAALKYIFWKLNQDNRNLSDVFCFLTDEAQNDFLRFKDLFVKYNFNINAVPLYNNGDIVGSFKSICEMFDVLQRYISENEEVVIHIDITGGPRHSVMLMLALIQMIKFSGAKIGLVIYANVLRKKNQLVMQKGMIEDVGDIMDMFTLTSGAEEFVSIGNVSQIQKYFESNENISWCLNCLLDCMEDFSETIRICGSYNSMIEVLARLSDSIKSYDNFLKENKGSLCEQELFFAKLLPKIKIEYMDIMPDDKKSATPIQIIRWCAKRKFLQQAVVFYTEWLPDYLIKSKLVEVTKKEIIDECEKAKMEWSSWPIHLFRNYVPAKEKSILQQEEVIKITSDKLTYEDLQKLLKSNLSASNILIKVKNKNEKFEEFIRNVIKFEKKTSWSNFSGRIEALDEDNPIKVILKKSAPNNISFKDYLDKRIEALKTASVLILTALKNAGRALSCDLFDLECMDKKENNAEEKGQNRIKAFKQLLKSNSLKTKIPENDLLEFIGQYSEYVNQWRNTFSHAVSKDSDKEKNISITKAILNSIALIDVKQ